MNFPPAVHNNRFVQWVPVRGALGLLPYDSYNLKGSVNSLRIDTDRSIRFYGSEDKVVRNRITSLQSDLLFG